MKNNSSKAYADQLVALSSKVVIDNFIWKIFGFKDRPSRGRFFKMFVKKEKLISENAFLREIFIVTLAYGIKYLNEINSYKHFKKIFYSIIETLIDTGGMYIAFDFNDNDEMYRYISEGINEYIEKGFEECHLIMLSRLNNITESKEEWFVGAMRLGVEENIKLYLDESLVDFQIELVDDISLKYFE